MRLWKWLIATDRNWKHVAFSNIGVWLMMILSFGVAKRIGEQGSESMWLSLTSFGIFAFMAGAGFCAVLFQYFQDRSKSKK